MQGEIIMTSYTKYKTTKGSFWRFQIFVGRDETGKRIVKQRRGFATKKEAQLAAIKLKTELQNNSFIGNEIITFNKVYELWFENYKLTTKESTWSTTERNFENHILPIFGSYPICKITPLQCQKPVNNWFSKPLRNYKRFLNDIARVFDYAVHLKIVKDNPTTAVIRPRPSQQTGKRKDEKDFYYTKNELNTFLECLYDMDDFQAYAFFRTLSFTGMRKGELLALTWQDIDFRDYQISINKTQSNGHDNTLIVQSPKTRASYRNIFIDPKTMKILQEWQTKQKIELHQLGFNSFSDEQLVFASEKNQMHNPNKPRTWMIRCTDQYNLRHIPVHGFRHTYATLAIQGGMAPKELQKQLGHSDIKTTLDIYTAVTDNQMQNIPAQFTAFVDF